MCVGDWAPFCVVYALATVGSQNLGTVSYTHSSAIVVLIGSDNFMFSAYPFYILQVNPVYTRAHLRSSFPERLCTDCCLIHCLHRPARARRRPRRRRPRRLGGRMVVGGAAALVLVTSQEWFLGDLIARKCRIGFKRSRTLAEGGFS